MIFTCLGTTLLEKAKGMSSFQLTVLPWLNTARFIFVDFRNVDDANLALTALHNHPFDAKHLFKVNRFTDIERFSGLDETYVEPELEDYTARVRSFLPPLTHYSKLATCTGTSSRLAC
jgi:hypothetical protein